MVGEVYCQLCSPYVYLTSDVRYVVTCDPGQTVSVWDLRHEDEYGVSAHVTIPLATIPPAMALIDKEGVLLVGTGFGNVFALPLDKVVTFQIVLWVSILDHGAILYYNHSGVMIEFPSVPVMYDTMYR